MKLKFMANLRLYRCLNNQKAEQYTVWPVCQYNTMLGLTMMVARQGTMDDYCICWTISGTSLNAVHAQLNCNAQITYAALAMMHEVCWVLGVQA